MDKVRRVWVLGAGFSRSLGGPLLRDLLTMNSRSEIAVRYPDKHHLHAGLGAKLVYWLYHFGRGWTIAGELGLNPRVNMGGEIWRDAEEFLEYLDSCSSNAPRRTRLEELVRRARPVSADPGNWAPPEVTALVALGRQLLATECCAFLHDVDTRTERWQPYQRWARQLGREDLIITFNYDRVLESLSAGASSQATNGICVLSSSEELDEWSESSATAVLKLHGSVDWRFAGDDPRWTFVVDPDPEYAVNGDPNLLAICSPGPSKAESAKRLGVLWKTARAALLGAHEVFFVGYRFPPSDAEARGMILNALRKNSNTDLEITTILGPEASDPWTKRVDSLLRTAVRREPRAMPLLAEDFLSFWEPR